VEAQVRQRYVSPSWQANISIAKFEVTCSLPASPFPAPRRTGQLRSASGGHLSRVRFPPPRAVALLRLLRSSRV